MALIPLFEAKTYLRVDSGDEDALIGILLSSAEQMCKDVGRLSDDQWEAVNAADRDAENGVTPTRELEALRSTCRVAILYALGYLYEHRDEADHMAKHAHPDQVPDTPDEWLENFNTFSIYQILPQLIELWGLNVQTEVEARKNLAKVSG